MMQSKEVLDAESNERLMAALFADDKAAEVERSKEVPSHQQLDLDEDGNPVQLRFVFVDETECIGCTFCADVARNTFYMNDDAGRARVFNQGGDDPEIVQEAIDTCPVMCISYVDHEDLVILETEREGITINPASIGVPKTWSVSTSALQPTKAKLGNGASMTCCMNCPSKGCKECPMYGVGLNPVYIERMEARAAKKEKSGEAAREREDAAKADAVGKLFDAPAPEASPLVAAETDELIGVVVPSAGSGDALSSGEPSNSFFDALYGAPAGYDDDVPLGFGSGDEMPLGVATEDRRTAEAEAQRAAEAEAAERRAAEEVAQRAAEEEARLASRLATEAQARAEAEAAEQARKEAEARAKEEAEAKRAEEARLALEALDKLPVEELTSFGLPTLVAGKLEEHRKKKGEISSFKFASPAIKQIAVNAIDAYIEALVQAEARGKELCSPSRAQLRACEVRRQELKQDREALS